MTFAIDSLDLVEGTYKLDVAVHKRDGYPVRLPPAALHLPREVAHARRRHLPPAPSLDVLAGAVTFRPSRTRRLTRRIAACCTLDEAVRLRRSACEPPAGRSCSPTASSICCTPATSATCSRRAQLGDALDRRRQLRSIGARQQGSRTARSPPSTSGPRSSRRSRASTRSSIFDEETPHAIIAALQPDVLVKGADWAADAIVGRDIVEARGGRVVRMPRRAGLLDDCVSSRRSRRSAESGWLRR